MSRRRSTYRLLLLPHIVLLLLVTVILSSCGGSLPSKGEQRVAIATPQQGIAPVGVPTNAAIPACAQPVCLAPATVKGVRPFIDTWNNVHIILPFSYSMQNAADVAQYYDFIWGANPGTVAALRQGNPHIVLSYYLSLNRDSGDFNNPDIGKWRGYGYWHSQHPDWILYRCDRVTPAYEIHDNNIPFDMTNEDFINWQIQQYALPASQAGFDAIAADNMNLDNAFGACGFYRNGQWVQRYTGNSDDPQWREDMLFWVTEMQKKLHELPHPLALIPNLGYYGNHAIIDPQGYQLVQKIVQHVDGILDESGFTQYGDGYLSDDAWVQTIKLIQDIQKQQRPYYMINEFPKAPLSKDDINWALASYLMGKEHLSALFYSGPQQYGKDLRYPGYDIPIGIPTSDMYLDQHVYWRVYSGGLVLVNPSSTNKYTVDLPKSGYEDIFKHPVQQTLTLKPHSGLVLLQSK